MNNRPDWKADSQPVDSQTVDSQAADSQAADSQAADSQNNGPLHAIATCPICGGGLCGIRICTGDDPTESIPHQGFVMCDECEAVWMEPDVSCPHLYVSPEHPKCPICRSGLWGGSRWATRNEIEQLGWTSALDPDLDPTE